MPSPWPGVCGPPGFGAFNHTRGGQQDAPSSDDDGDETLHSWTLITISLCHHTQLDTSYMYALKARVQSFVGATESKTKSLQFTYVNPPAITSMTIYELVLTFDCDVIFFKK
jgi:hypothetical protein